MLGLAVRFDFGRYHATRWGTHVNEGEVDWPPSPWRLLRALYAAGTTDTNLNERQAGLERALVSLCRSGAPSFSLPAS